MHVKLIAYGSRDGRRPSGIETAWLVVACVAGSLALAAAGMLWAAGLLARRAAEAIFDGWCELAFGKPARGVQSACEQGRHLQDFLAGCRRRRTREATGPLLILGPGGTYQRPIGGSEI